MHCSYHSCSAALCLDPVDIDHGIVTFTGNSVDDTATYTCVSGFELIGAATTTCTLVDVNSATFQPMPPVCRREYYINVFRVAVFLHNCLTHASQCSIILG